MATEARSNFNHNYIPGLFAAATGNFKEYDPVWKEFMTVRKSSEAFERSSYKSGFGYLVQKAEGTPATSDSRIQGYLKYWEHDAFALAVRITHEAIEDDRQGDIKQAGSLLGRSAAQTYHLLATRMLMNAAATTYHTAGDALALCVSNHVRLDGSTWSNVASAAAPTTTSVENAVLNFEAIVDNRGMQYDQRARSVVCGRTHEFTISKILESSLVAGNANNDKNTLRSRRSLKMIVDPYITDGRWFVQGEKDPDVGLIHFDREKPMVRRHGDPDNGDVVFTVYCRFSNEANDPRQLYMIPAV